MHDSTWKPVSNSLKHMEQKLVELAAGYMYEHLRYFMDFHTAQHLPQELIDGLRLAFEQYKQSAIAAQEASEWLQAQKDSILKEALHSESRLLDKTVNYLLQWMILSLKEGTVKIPLYEGAIEEMYANSVYTVFLIDVKAIAELRLSSRAYDELSGVVDFLLSFCDLGFLIQI